MASVADLVDAEPVELNRRGYSLNAVGVPGGSWTVGKMHSNRPTEKTSNHSTHGGNRVSDHGNRGVSLEVARRRNSLSMVVGHDAAAVRGALRAGPVNIHAFAGVINTSSAFSMHPAVHSFRHSVMHALLHAFSLCLLCVCHVLHVSATNGHPTIILFYNTK